MSFFRLGEILIKEGLLTHEHLQKAIEKQKLEGGRLGEILVKMGFLSEENMAAALGSQLGIPYYKSDHSDLLDPQKDQGLEHLIPADFCRKNHVLPLSLNMNSLTCAMSDPSDLLLIDNLRRITGCDINVVIVTPTAIESALKKFLPLDRDDTKGTLLNQAVEKTYGSEFEDSLFRPIESSTSAELSLDNLIEKAGEAPVIKLVDLIIRQAIDESASDIHIEPFKDKIYLRYRIDGTLINIPPPAPQLHLAIVSRIKILAKLNIAEKRLPQDGAISARLEDRNVDIRVSTLPTVWGEKVVLRILDKGSTPIDLSKLGFDSLQTDLVKKAVSHPHGLFFVTGPTGSGKSTTLYACLHEVMSSTKNILTVEDPVEYKIETINQVNVRPEIGLTFSTALRSFMRQDPNIIMVGEVRDMETAQICVRAALTGHFVLSTLHTNDAASAIARLVDLGIPAYLLTPSLVMVIGQRLAKCLCPKCKEPYEPNPDEHDGIRFKCDLIYRAKGCEECNNLGYKGRRVISEVLAVSDEIRQLIGKGADAGKIKQAACAAGMSTIFESGIKLIEKGITSYEEICRVSVE